MARIPRSVTALLTVLSVAAVGCLFPTDDSETLHVEADGVPFLLVKESYQLSARLMDDANAEVPGAEIQYSSADQTVASVSSDGVLLAVGSGTVTITATAAGFESAQAATIQVRVRDLLEVDSITPATVRFGEYLTLWGIGLDPDQVFQVSVGGEEAPLASYTPNPQDPRFGSLSVWVKPPADFQSTVSVLGVNGGVVATQPVTVQQRDLFEPNDTTYTDLGALPNGYRNPALAFESRLRDGLEATDWYRFTNSTDQTRTIVLGGEGIGAETFEVWVTDSMYSYEDAGWDYWIGYWSWAIGPQVYACDGWLWYPAELGTPVAVMALQDLPGPWDYHIVSFYDPAPAPRGYGMVVANEYISVLAPDDAEENDYCDAAPYISVGTGASFLTIDNPHDIDWFWFDVAAGGQTVTITLASEDEESDLDLYVLTADGWLDEVAWSLAGGTTEELVAVLPENYYYLAVVDYPGVPTRYQLTWSAAAPPAAGPVTVAQYQSEASVQGRLQKLDTVGPRQTPRLTGVRR